MDDIGVERGSQRVADARVPHPLRRSDDRRTRQRAALLHPREGLVPQREAPQPDRRGTGGDRTARQVAIAGLRGPYFMLSKVRAGEGQRTTLLSPFDNLIIDRQRTEILFGMRYRMEIYVPKHLRVRGFWAMPILHRDQLIGTVDPKIDRQRGVLDVVTFHLERDAPRDRSTRRAIEDAVDDLAAFAGAHEVAWPKGIASSYSRR